MSRPIPLSHQTLREATRRTLAHYNHNADDFFAGTRDHDVRVTLGKHGVLGNTPCGV